MRKGGEVLRKHIGIIIDLEGFTLMSKTAALSAISLRILIRLLTKFWLQVSTTVRSSTNFHLMGNFLAELFIITEKGRGPRREPWGTS